MKQKILFTLLLTAFIIVWGTSCTKEASEPQNNSASGGGSNDHSTGGGGGPR